MPANLFIVRGHGPLLHSFVDKGLAPYSPFHSMKHGLSQIALVKCVLNNSL
jgi:hypothetical protein